ncbi:MAG: nicotinamide mononucleotide transporter [Clostridia bacterium]|nr:nicotinamide mononucleotide transporter [Clostridia bacterium]
MKVKKFLTYLTPFEWCLWLGSLMVILLSYLLGGDYYILTLIASLMGVTALIFIAKGNVVGHFFIIIFSILYGIISWNFRYYGEMITYVFMSLPSSVIACITWLKNPSKRGKSEVAVAPMTKKKLLLVGVGDLVVTIAFYFILRHFNTANLIPSTISVATSFFAASLLILRSPYYALGYSVNDIVLILLWTFASIKSLSYLPMIFCFLTFLVNDGYGFLCWKRMQKRQREELVSNE